MSADSECMYIHDQAHQSMISFCHMTCDVEDGAVEYVVQILDVFKNKFRICDLIWRKICKRPK